MIVLKVGGSEGIDLAAMPAFLRFMAGRFGYAAKPIADRLQKKGGDLAVPPEGFIVLGAEGPLKEGELERAAEWGRRVVGTGERPHHRVESTFRGV